MLATTFSIVAVFLPVAFMGGIIGRFFFQFGIMVSAAVLISLFVVLHPRPDAVVDLVRPAGPGGSRPLRPPASRPGRAAQRASMRVLRRSLRWPKTHRC